MAHTKDANHAVTTLIQRYTKLKVAVSMTQEELEEQLHAEVWRGDWGEVLRLLALAKDGIARVAANECAVLAVQKAPVEVVGKLLDLLPEGEHTGRDAYLVDWSPTGDICRRLKWDIFVQGTLLMHAVANDRPDVVKLLLDHGYDVNCASVNSTAALLQDFSDHVSGYGRDFIPFHAWMARPENCVKLRKWDADPNDIPPMCWQGATPLALAVLLGRADCARILVERGAWLEEAPSVSAAMYLFWRKTDPAYQAARTVVLAAGDHARHRPVLWAAGETCSARQLKGILEAWEYSTEELTKAARCMVLSLRHQRELWKTYTNGWMDLCQRMNRIGQVCPEAVQAREVIGEFLDHYLSWKGADIQPLLPVLQGGTLDISGMRVGYYYLARQSGQRIIRELAAHCTLIMDRDAIEPGLPAGALHILLKHVTFLPSAADSGISGLTQALLRSGDLRLIRSALKNGLIPPEETTEELLLCQQRYSLPNVCRSALLTTPRPRKADRQMCPRTADLSHHWFRDSIPEQTMPILEDADWARWFWPTLRNACGQRNVQAAGVEWQLHKTFFAACMEGRTDIVSAWLPYLHPEDLCNIESAYAEEKDALVTMTPLCAAALSGQTEIVKMLLNHGAPLREELWGAPSVYTACWRVDDKEKELSFNPVLAAALGSHWDTVRCLLERGAVCDWSAPGNRYIWQQFHAEDLAETALRQLKGEMGHDVSK